MLVLGGRYSAPVVMLLMRLFLPSADTTVDTVAAATLRHTGGDDDDTDDDTL